VDYAVAEFDGTQTTSVAVLGDDRVRFYVSDANGAFLPSGELMLPAGAIPLSLAATTYRLNHPSYSDSQASVVVSTLAADSPGTRAVHVFLNQGNGFGPARVYGYLVPDNAGQNNARVLITGLNGQGRLEVIVVNGSILTVLYDILDLDF
jgi:hypothetical protein